MTPSHPSGTRAASRARSKISIFAIAVSAVVLAFAVACGMPSPPARHALLYGISIYDVGYPEGTYINLTYTDDDASAMASALSAKGWTVKLGLADTQVAADSQDATRAAIEADIAELAGTDGLVLFYYSGHGTRDAYTGTSYILPYGSIATAADRISADELRAMFEAAGLSHVIAILDSCYSGGFVQAGVTVDGVPDIFGANDPGGDIAYTAFIDALGDALEAYVSYGADSRYVFISAAGSEELSWESSSSGHGIFTSAALNAFDDSSADSDNDGYVSTAELYAYCVKAIVASWNSYKEDDLDYYSDGQYADFYPHLSGVAREYALWEAP